MRRPCCVIQLLVNREEQHISIKRSQRILGMNSIQALLHVRIHPDIHGASFRSQYVSLLHTETPPKDAAPPPIAVAANTKNIAQANGAVKPAKVEKPSSKIEETVLRLKEKQIDKAIEEKKHTLPQAAVSQALEELQRVAPESKKVSKEEPEAADSAATAKSVAVAKKPLWDRFKDECKHYYSGFKLLYLDVKVSSKILWKVLQGNNLTRRENKQLIRTVSDLFRLVPFSVFVVVPFMEFLLPVALKLFPGMLPSTFTTKSERENKMRRTLKAKLEYAKFLQKTLDEMGPTSTNNRSSKSAADFVEFYRSVKEQGRVATNDDIIKFSKLFEDEITLDNMTRDQLVALCRLLELTPIGTNAFLRLQLEMKIRQLKTDDRVIQREGIEALDVAELQNANKERGMRALGMPEERLRKQLAHWLELSLNHNIPPSLLLLSRTLYLPETLAPTAQIAATISVLPESAVTQTSAQIGEREGKIRNVVRLELIQEEQRKIEQEEAERNKKMQEEFEKKKEEAPLEVAKEAVDKETLIDKAPTYDVGQEVEMLTDTSSMAVGPIESVEDPVKRVVATAAKAEISSEDLTELKSAIESLGKAGSSQEEVEEIDHLKKELQDYEEDLEDLSYVKAIASRPDIEETPGARRLFGKVNKMLGKLDNLVVSLQDKEKQLEANLQEDSISDDEKTSNAKNLVTIQELTDAVQKLQGSSDTSKVEQIAQVLQHIDDDSDGLINVAHVLNVIELLGTEHVQLESNQIGKIIDMLKREEMLEVETNIEKILSQETKDLQPEQKQEGAFVEKVAEIKDDIAIDLTETEPEAHIKEMFAKPAEQPQKKPLQDDDCEAEESEEAEEPSSQKRAAVMHAKCENKNGPSNLQ